MKRMLIVALTTFSFSLLTGFASCNKGPAWKRHTFVHRDVKPSGGVVLVPEGLWDKIKSIVDDSDMNKAEKSSEKPAEKPGEEKQGRPNSMVLPTEFAPLKIYLIEKNEGILKTQSIELSFAAGGGDIDLSDFVNPLKGSFYLVAEFMPDLEGATRKTFFVSNSITRQRKEERIGSGCHDYYDVTSAFNKAALGEGLLLNTTDERHVSALAGTYIFAALNVGQSRNDKKLYLASLTIHDSAHRELTCRH